MTPSAAASVRAPAGCGRLDDGRGGQGGPAVDDDATDAILYRIAYARACDVIDAARFRMSTRRMPRATRPEALAAEVARALGLDGPPCETLVEAIDDALAGRRPRW